MDEICKAVVFVQVRNLFSISATMTLEILKVLLTWLVFTYFLNTFYFGDVVDRNYRETIADNEDPFKTVVIGLLSSQWLLTNQ